MTGARDPLFSHRQEGRDATGKWVADAEIVHGLVVASIWRAWRWRAPVRFTLDEFEAFCRRSLEIVANARLAKRGAA